VVSGVSRFVSCEIFREKLIDSTVLVGDSQWGIWCAELSSVICDYSQRG
jgi:hypothetical protein